MTRITCGIFIITRTDRLLVAHPTRSPMTVWSIPKGKVEEGESEIDAAIREMEEESSINLLTWKDKIKPIGRFKYKNAKKILSAFVLYEKDCPGVDFTDKNLICRSLVPQELGGYPENDAFKWITLNEALGCIHESQIEALKKIIDV